jgi:hypothetical protein
MKQIKKIHLLAFIMLSFAFSSCRLWEKVFPPKYGCQTNGKNVGAEQLLSENKSGKKGGKAARKAKKFRA